MSDKYDIGPHRGCPSVSGPSDGFVASSSLPPPLFQSLVVRDAYASLISRYDWNTFATLTYRSWPGGEQVVRDFRTWLFSWAGDVACERGLARWHVSSGGQRHLRGWWVNARRRQRQEVVYVVGVESQRSGRLHAHALIRWPECFGSVLQICGRQLWEKRHGGAYLEFPNSQNDVARYVSKYIVKEGAELVISDSFRAAAMVDASLVA